MADDLNNTAPKAAQNSFSNLLLAAISLAFLGWLSLEMILLFSRLMPSQLRELWQAANITLYARAAWLDVMALLHGLVIIAPLVILIMRDGVLTVGEKPPHAIIARMTTALVGLILIAACFEPALLALERQAGSYDPLGWRQLYLLDLFALILGFQLLVAAFLIKNKQSIATKREQ